MSLNTWTKFEALTNPTLATSKVTRLLNRLKLVIKKEVDIDTLEGSFSRGCKC